MARFRVKMNERRFNHVKLVWDTIVTEGSGTLNIKDLEAYYHAENFMDVKNKKYTQAEVFAELREYMPMDQNGNISFNDWVYFYVDFSNTITSDNNFSRML